MQKSQQVAAEAFSLLQAALEESEARVEELENQLERLAPLANGDVGRVEVLEHRLRQAEIERQRYQTEAGQLEDVVENLNAKVDSLQGRLDVAESGPDKLTKKEVNFWRAKAESFDEQTAEYKSRIVALRKDLESREKELSELRFAAESASEAALESVAAELRETREKLELAEQDAREARGEADSAREEQANAAAAACEKLGERDSAMADLANKAERLENEIAALQDDLREERECAENLSEVANNRLDELNKYREQQEETQERLEESEWRLRKALHFERLVHRRKGLITSLIDTIRAKTKANTALKAGLDSLRRYKASAQASEQKLLAEIERIKAELGRARESLNNRQDANVDRRRLSESGDRIEELEARVASQAEIIDALEQELKLAKVVQADLNNKSAEARQQIEQQQEALDAAAADSLVDRDNDRLMIDALEQEVTQLRKQIAASPVREGADPHSDEASSAGSEELEAMEARIAELKEEAASWKRKYEFLSTEAPDAYQDQAAAEK
jgi:chromosome segregation ATPase